MSDAEVSAMARRLGSLPKAKRHKRTCPVCGSVFDSTARGIYDKATCRAKAQTMRLRQAKGPRHPEVSAQAVGETRAAG